MITRRLREWPRATAAVTVLAIGLVLVGVLVASAGSSGAAHAASRPPRAAAQHPAQAGASASATIARLQHSLSQESGRLTAARSALAASQAAARCWQGKAHHPRKERAVQCPPGS